MMKKYFIKHKLAIGDITHLSDSDSELILSGKEAHIEDIVEIETYEKIFLGQITDISKNSVEVEIIEEKGTRDTKYVPSITIIQSLSNDSKFNYFIEKSVEIGIEKIIPVETKYSLKNKKKALKDYPLWNKIVKDATEQSRNIFPTIIEKPLNMEELAKYQFENNSIKICLATENVPTKYLSDIVIDSRPVYIAIGPEKGWSSSDIDILKRLGFQFIQLKGNILRTETTGLVIGSIIKYIKGEI
ncbi:MAG TPA: RsmE family RNA methyltransferase [Candidatus Dojkabacteria bacterium]|nr:RsmE family RNA methyltransferase [Candidatus Dojkabacteria bacterium]HOR05792.1 RsmE family RNA methyltransferase [Candidatus Dojkabacteria bacterium]HOT61154.1 RsmE family RNA methyltransferase [Candidatus Dojkabacteria bacterium]HQI92564.1 RsmE family RNA methyltransferase [Candidatus Dojkabacteria bacterium]